MTAVGATAPLTAIRRPAIDPGRPFLHPAFDYLVIGGGLSVVPRACVLAGFSYTQSFLLIVAVINVHHFIVDAYIWRLRRDRGYAAVAGSPAP